jgi:hypothetical protein
MLRVPTLAHGLFEPTHHPGFVVVFFEDLKELSFGSAGLSREESAAAGRKQIPRR